MDSAEHARHGAAYLDYCLGRVQKAKGELEKMIADNSGTPLATWSYFLRLCHLEDEKMISHYKENELKKWFSSSDGEKCLRFYEQEVNTTQKTLQKNDLNEYRRKLNMKKLEALNVLLPILKEKVKDEEFRSQWGW